MLYQRVSPPMMSMASKGIAARRDLMAEFQTWVACESHQSIVIFIELDDGKIYRKALYLMVKTMVSCKFSLKPIQ